MPKEAIRKRIKNTGNQMAITFSSEETECYKLKKGQIFKVTLELVEEA